MNAATSPFEPLQSLRDIQDMPPLGWWPPAAGWWLLVLGVIAIGFGIWRWRVPLSLRMPFPGITLGNWRWDAAVELRKLRRRVGDGQDAKVSAAELSELLRRIAMARQGRPACAGLSGADWLDWLSAQDPHGFPWHERGRVLTSAPYAPSFRDGDGQLPGLIDAAESWVIASADRSGTAGRAGGWFARIVRLRGG